MKTENVWGLSSLLRNDKDLLWVIPESTAVPVFTKEFAQRSMISHYQSLSDPDSVSNSQSVIFYFNNHKISDVDWIQTIQKCARPPIVVIDEKMNPDRITELQTQLEGQELLACLVFKDNWSEVEEQIKFVLQNQSKAATSMRGLVRSIKEMSAASDISSLLTILKTELSKMNAVLSPIVGVADSAQLWRLFFFQGNDIIERTTDKVWPQGLKNRLNDIKDSQYLADILERPFVQLLSIPLLLRREVHGEAHKVPAVLFLEHAIPKKDLSEFLEFVEARIQPFAIALDRILLSTDLNKASILWERTFDSLKDPIAIFDAEGHLIRGNKIYSKELGDLHKVDSQAKFFKYGEKYFEPKSYPIHFDQNRFSSNTIIHFLDVTRSHQLRRQMVQNEKMAALGHLAGNIAHELNNPLTGVRSLAQVLQKQAKEGTPLLSDLLEVEKAAERCQIIIQNLLDFSSGGVGEKISIVRFHEIIDKTLPLLKATMRLMHVETDFLNTGDEVKVEPHLMQQVVFNIIKNACQSMEDGGQLILKTELKEIISQQINGRYVIFSIKDNGSGIPTENLDKIFEYFFTTKSQGEGTGLGLGMSKNIVQRFQGHITVKSEVGKGSEFCVLLPYAGTSS